MIVFNDHPCSFSHAGQTRSLGQPQLSNPSDLPCSVSGWHGFGTFGSVTQVCFGISVSNFMCMSFVAVGRSLTIVSYVAFKMAALWFWTMFNCNRPIAHCHPLLWGGGILVDHWSTISSFVVVLFHVFFLLSCIWSSVHAGTAPYGQMPCPAAMDHIGIHSECSWVWILLELLLSTQVIDWQTSYWRIWFCGKLAGPNSALQANTTKPLQHQCECFSWVP